MFWVTSSIGIETGSISQVEDIERELQGGALSYFRYLCERKNAPCGLARQ